MTAPLTPHQVVRGGTILVPHFHPQLARVGCDGQRPAEREQECRTVWPFMAAMLHIDEQGCSRSRRCIPAAKHRISAASVGHAQGLILPRGIGAPLQAERVKTKVKG